MSFVLSEFLRVWHQESWHKMPMPDRNILDQISENHLIPEIEIRSRVDIPMRVHRGYATVAWEHDRGRDGTSQHCFHTNEANHGKLGANDTDFWYDKDQTKRNYLKLAQAYIDSPYKRISWYPNMRFFHKDYKSNERQYFIQSPGGWNYVGSDPKIFIKKVSKSFA